MQDIETTIFKSLLFNEPYARTVYPHLRPDFFDGHYRQLFDVYSDLFDNYGKIPNVEAIGVALSKSNVSESDFEQIVEVVEYALKTSKDLPDTEWLIDETEQYCRDKALYNSIYESINIIEGTNKTLDKHAIPDILNDALSVSFKQTVGKDYFDDAEARYEKYVSKEARIPFPLEALNYLSNGGAKKKSLSAILAGCVHPDTKVRVRVRKKNPHP